MGLGKNSNMNGKAMLQGARVDGLILKAINHFVPDMIIEKLSI
jgi:hypothetical protein